MRSLTTALALAALVLFGACDTSIDCPTSVVEDTNTATNRVEPAMPDGLHFGKVTCLGTCRITVKREGGASAWRWYEDEGELKNDGTTTLDQLVVKNSVSYFTLTVGSTVELELIQPPPAFVGGSVMTLESTSAWYTFGYYNDTKEGPVWKDSAFAGVPGSAVGVVFDYVVIN